MAYMECLGYIYIYAVCRMLYSKHLFRIGVLGVLRQLPEQKNPPPSLGTLVHGVPPRLWVILYVHCG